MKKLLFALRHCFGGGFIATPIRKAAWNPKRYAGVAVFFAIALMVARPLSPKLLADNDHNPIGVAGGFEGVITTGCAYNVLNHNARRQIDDIVVPGSIGKYPLKMTRYYNSRSDAYSGPMGPGWSHEYQWSASISPRYIRYPNGTEIDNQCFDSVGISDYWQTLSCSPCVGDFRLADGGTVHFDSTNGYFQARTIKDPYGQITTLAYYSSGPQLGFLSRVTEPGQRYLQFTYNASLLLTQVDAYDGQGNQIDSVVYNYAPKPTGGSNPSTAMCLTSVDYQDGTQAKYTYREDNQPNHPDPPCPCMIKLLPLVSGFNDVRYHGPMRRVAYDYQEQGPHGAILKERYWDGVAGNEGNGALVSRIDPPAPSPLTAGATFDTSYTEYRGDGPTRTFTYTSLHLIRLHNGEPQVCPESFTGPAPQQFPTDYTDFRGNSTHIGYDPNWYVSSVRDANTHTTSYVRGSPPPAGIGEVLTITHPGGSHIDYTYYDHGHYVHTVSNERQKVTTYTRDPTTHLVTRIDYPSDANTPASYEEFTYNGFGQVLTHHLTNGAWESFVYGGRGLLIDKYNPKQGSVPGGTDPHAHYTYYTSGWWTDRVQTVTLPANGASETYEYDRALSGGVTNLNGAAVAGRGLVTKITHADGKYQQFKYDAYGNKKWEDNELRKATSYAYDDYNRLISTTDPLQNSESFSYLKPGATSSYRHTTNSIYTHTSRAGVVTTNAYDENWRKTSTSVAPNTLNLTTRFAYDNVGNLTDVTDPRSKITHNGYDNRNRKTSTTDAYNTALARTTVWHYDPANNINRIDRPDAVTETKVFDALNRMTSHTIPRNVPGASPTPTVIPITTGYNYDPSGTVQKITDPSGNQTTFSYNASDERITMTYPGGTQSQSWVYDAAHHLLSRTTVRGGSESQRFSYDNRNRKTQMRWDNTVDWADYGYDDVGRLTSAKNSNSTVTRQYDAAGHLAWEQQNVTGVGSTKTVNYPGYDGDGRLTNVNVANASYDYTYSYDDAGRFEKIKLTSNGSVQFEYAYDPASNETDRYSYLPNNVKITQHYSRDSLNRMASRIVKKGTTYLSTEAYTCDHMDRITQVSRGSVADEFGFYKDGNLQWATYGGQVNIPYTEGQDPDLDTTDNIDLNGGYQPPASEEPEPTPPPPASGNDPPSNPIENASGGDLPGGRIVGYALSRTGNRTAMADTVNGTVSYTSNGLNQYTGVSGTNITNGPEHEVQTFNGAIYAYVNDEHLKQVSDGISKNYYLYYDALGRCVKRSLTDGPTTTTTYYIYDGEKPVLEYNANTIIGRNVYGKGIDEILMRIETGVNNGYAMYYAQDHEGSVTHLLDGRSTPSNQTGEVIERYKYDVFGAPTFLDGGGNQLNPNATVYNNRFLFTGREYAATYRGAYTAPFTFYEYRARAYNPQLGRFMSEDPKLFDGGDYNLFRYCHNDPIDFTDPTGMQDTVVTHSPRETSLTNAEKISLWQKSMETSIGAERAVNELQNSKVPETTRMEKSSPVGPYPHPKDYQQYLAQVRAIEGGNPGLESPAFNPLDLLTGAFAAKAVLPSAAKTVVTSEGTQLYRVFGNEAKGLGQYYTTVNPANVENYRLAAGLFPKNSGQFVLEGALRNTDGVIFGGAAPGPGGVGGGLRQVFVPSPQTQINILRVSGANPEF